MTADSIALLLLGIAVFALLPFAVIGAFLIGCLMQLIDEERARQRVDVTERGEQQ